MTTRICHSKGIVELCDRKDIAVKEYVKNAKTRVATPGNARQMRHTVEKRLKDLVALSNNCKWNYAIYNDKRIGVITSGGVFNYAQEAFGDFASYLKIGFSHPLPTTLIEEFAANVDKLYIIEENDKYIEEHVKALGIDCIGKDIFPYTGEMTPDVIIESVTGEKTDAFEPKTDQLIARPPTFCAGCPHREVFLDLGKRKDIVVAGDIGCYALGAGPPYNAIDWVLCMGGSFSTAHGAQLVLNSVGNTKQKMVSVLGDSTFFHTGINSLIEAVYNKSNGVHIILDNRITGMTGGQENPGSGFNANGDVSEEISIPRLVEACGVKNIKIINPNNRADVKETMDWALASNELCVIITEWPCVLKRAYSETDEKKFDGAFSSICTVDEEKCIGCKKCLKTGCPALGYRTENKKAFTIKGVCVGCGVCTKECPVDAIK
jgi:indolepyruvate ferredoxin oxidoreductase alpha subunit